MCLYIYDKYDHSIDHEWQSVLSKNQFTISNQLSSDDLQVRSKLENYINVSNKIQL